MLTLLFLILMSIIAGILTGIVGMASLTLYPVLLAVGVPPITANATITIAQVGGGVGTVLSSFKELRHHWRQAFQVALLNTLGGVLGAIILVHSSNAGFQKVVPIFILLAGVLILVPKSKREITKNHWFNVLGWLGVFLVGIYSGYFGAAAGLLMIAVLSKIINEEYAIYNAMRNFATFCNNVVAASIFAWRLTIDWQVIVPLLVGLFVGGYLGPIIVRYVPSRYIKTAVGIFALLLAVYLGYQAYF